MIRYRISTHPNGNDLQIEWNEPRYGEVWSPINEPTSMLTFDRPRKFRDRRAAHLWIDEQILALKARENNRKPGYEYYP